MNSEYGGPLPPDTKQTMRDLYGPLSQGPKPTTVRGMARDLLRVLDALAAAEAHIKLLHSGGIGRYYQGEIYRERARAYAAETRIAELGAKHYKALRLIRCCLGCPSTGPAPCDDGPAWSICIPCWEKGLAETSCRPRADEPTPDTGGLECERLEVVRVAADVRVAVSEQLLADARELVLMSEWGSSGDSFCPGCGGWADRGGHKTSCALAAFLAKTRPAVEEGEVEP